jgi:hypothetical protein
MELTKAVYLLTDAAEILRCDKVHLLRLAANDELHLYIAVPASVSVYNVGISDVQTKTKPDERIGRPQPTKATAIDFLSLWADDCAQLLSTGTCAARTFPGGGGLDANGNLQCPKPPCPPYASGMFADYKGLDKVIRYFALYRNGTESGDWEAMMHPKRLEVLTEALFVSRAAMLALREKQRDDLVTVLGQVALEAKPHTSSNLRVLGELHNRIWGQAHLPGFQPLTHASISERLQVEHNFKRNLAECGAWIIGGTSLDSDAKTGNPRLDATRLKVLIRCSDVFWSSLAAQAVQDRSNEKVAKWLIKEYDFPPFRAKVAASLIRPSTAAKGRPRRDSE